METKETYEKFRGELNRIFSEGDSHLEGDKNFLELILASNDPKGVRDLAKEMKEEWNTLLKKGRFDDALEKYGFTGFVLSCFEFGEEDRKDLFELAFCALLNSATCLSKKREFEQAGLLCTLILEYNPKYVKALFRRAMAALELGEKVYAYYDLLLALEVDHPTRKLSKSLIKLGNLYTIKDQGKP